MKIIYLLLFGKLSKFSLDKHIFTSQRPHVQIFVLILLFTGLNASISSMYIDVYIYIDELIAHCYKISI